MFYNYRANLLIGLVVIAFISKVEAKELKIGYFINSPHVTNVESKSPEGALVDWFEQYIQPRMQMGLNWEENKTPVRRLLQRLKEGKVDIGIFFVKSPKREKFLYYPTTPFLVSTPSLLVKSSFTLNKINNLNEIRTLNIGFVDGGFIPSILENKNIQFILMSGSEPQKRNVEMMMLNRLDAVFAPQDISLHYLVRKLGLADDAKVLNLPLPDMQIYAVFSKKSTNIDIVEQYQNALTIANDQFSYRKFLLEWHVSNLDE